jgi:hypothetical protein
MPSPDYREAVHMDMYCLTFSRGWQQKNAALQRNKPFVTEAGRRISWAGMATWIFFLEERPYPGK